MSCTSPSLRAAHTDADVIALTWRVPPQGEHVAHQINVCFWPGMSVRCPARKLPLGPVSAAVWAVGCRRHAC